MFLKKFFKNIFCSGAGDYHLIITFFVLIFLGLAILASASYFIGEQQFGDPFYFLKRQLLRGVLPGLILFFLFSFIDYKNLRKIAFPLFVLALLLLIAVFIPGIGEEREGVRRWITIGFSFQSSEIAKIFFIIYLSAWLAKNKKEIKKFKEVFLPFLIFLGLISCLIILQPDFGTLIVFILTGMIIYFLAGAAWHHLIILMSLSIPGFYFLIKIAPYRLNRLLTFFNPLAADPSGTGYHLNQAILAISSGGLWGRGLGYSTQKVSSLPQVLSDSIFAVMAEEFGFIQMLAIVGLYLFLFYRIFLLAQKTDFLFGRLLAGGIGFLFIFQAIVNMGAMLGLLPLTGIPLPLIGYGSTNFVVFCLAFGILVNISRQTNFYQKTLR